MKISTGSGESGKTSERSYVRVMAEWKRNLQQKLKIFAMKSMGKWRTHFLSLNMAIAAIYKPKYLKE